MSRCIAVFLVVFAVFFSGCGPGGIPVNYVEGTVTLNGTPLADAVVSFSPVQGGTGKAAVGTTDDKGVFKLTAAESSNIGGGTAPGEYLVSITKPTESAVVDPEAWKTDPNYGKASSDSPTKVTEIKSEVPADYWVANTSGLTASVKSGSNTGIKFELTKTYKAKK